MTRTEQVGFVKELCANIAKVHITAIKEGRIPAGWDGHELRCLLADHFEDSASMSVIRREPRKGRARAYRNTVQTGNLDRS